MSKFQLMTEDFFETEDMEQEKKTVQKSKKSDNNEDTLKMFQMFMEEHKKQQKPKKQYKSEEQKQKMLEVLANARLKAKNAIIAKKEAKLANLNIDKKNESEKTQKPAENSCDIKNNQQPEIPREPAEKQPQKIEVSEPKKIILSPEEIQRQKIADYLKRCNGRRR